MRDYLELRTAFYPCCGTDFGVPIKLLRPFSDRIIFCDINLEVKETYEKIISKRITNNANYKLIIDSAHNAINRIQKIDVLFYRCDSGGEGGSNVRVLGDRFLSLVLARMPLSGGLIITDGSNLRFGGIKKFLRESGREISGWHVQLHPEIPSIHPPDHRSYNQEKLLYVLQATPIIDIVTGRPPDHFDLGCIYF